jgi:tetratricopeptide (TPR) repeat protein
MNNTMHIAWSWVRVELGVAVLALLSLIVPFVLIVRYIYRHRHGWNTFAREFDSDANGIFTEKIKHRSLLEWTFWPLLLISIGGFWIGIPGMRALQYTEKGNQISFGSQLPMALRWYRKALTYNPDFGPAHHGIGNILMEQGKLQEAQHEYEAAIRFDPGNAVYHRDLGVLWLKYGNNEAALIEYYRAAGLDFQASEIHAEFAQLLVADGQLDEAIKQYKIAMRYSHDAAQIHLDLANAYVMKDDYDAALEHYSLFVSLNPNSPQAYNNYGVLLYSTKKYTMAATAFRKAMRLDRNYAEPYYNLGRVSQKLGDTAQALQYYRAFLPVAGKKPEYANTVLEANKQLRILDLQPLSEKTNSTP